MANIGYSTLSVIPSAKGFGKALAADVDPQLDDAGRTSGARFGKILGGAAVAAAGIALAGIAAVVKTGLDEAMDASAVNAQLEAGILSTGNAANVTVEGMNDLAASIQGFSGQTDDSIGAAQSLLLTFTNIKNVGADKIFDRATLAASNMAAKFGGDASSQAILLGKALNDPIAGMGALARAGVQFTEGQKASIEAMVESGDVMGAQKLILGELETQFGGAAAAAGKSLPGQLEIAKRKFEDVSQTIAEELIPVVLPALTKLADVVTDDIIPAVGIFFGALSGNSEMNEFDGVLKRINNAGFRLGEIFREYIIPAFDVFFGALSGNSELNEFDGWLKKVNNAGITARDIFTKVGAALAALTRFVQQNMNWLVPFVATVLAVVAAYKVFTIAQWALNAALSANPIGLVIIAIAALVAAILWAYNNVDWFKTGIDALGVAFVWMWDKVLKPYIDVFVTTWTWMWDSVIKPVVDFIVGYFTLMGEAYSTLWTTVLEPYITALGALWVWLWENAIMPAVDFIVGYFTFLKDSGVAAFDLLSAGIGLAAGVISGIFDGVVSAFQTVIDFFSNAVSTISGVFTKIGDGISGVFKGAFNGIADMWNRSVGKLSFTVPDIIGVPNRGETFSFPKIPYLAEGGIVTKPTLAMIGEGRESEAVIPLSKLDGMVDERARSNPSDLASFAKQVAAEIQALARAESGRALDSATRGAALAQLAGIGRVALS